MKKNMQILIVDDDEEDRSFFIAAVKDVDKGIVCREAKNGEAALLMLKDTGRTLPDCIFLDLRMPRLNGKECLKEIKSDERLKQIPVYIYTTSRELKESEEMKKMGAVHFIKKPNSDQEIYYLVACALEEQFKLSTES